jgi:RNA polymerase sigma-70 factor (ECF subfamily)
MTDRWPGDTASTGRLACATPERARRDGGSLTEDEFARTLDAACAGDEAAFVRLFRSMQPVLLRYLRVVAGPLAEDVASDTWVAVVRDLRRFTGGEDAFRAWLLSIARRRWIDALRVAGRRPELTVDDLPERVAADDVPDAVEEIVTTERALALIARLPRDQAEVILLRVVAGLDVATTAELVGKQSGHVRVLAHRGLKRLRGFLEAQVPTNPL